MLLLCATSFLIVACEGDPGDRSGGIATGPDSGDGDCFDESCWWDVFHDLPYDGEPQLITAVLDAGVADARRDGPAPADAIVLTDAPPDSGCVAQPEPNCPATLPGYSQETPPILSGGVCRGACGPKCPAQCGIRPNATQCFEWQTGDCQWHSKVCSYPVQSCGSHMGCRDHDACYDGCAWATWPAACRRTCDIGCLKKWGKMKCESWMMGGGPYDKQIEYTGRPTSTTYNTTCY